ncbi:hypothetical protein BaRGS_00022502 [Batillaria attramentaria]|uniref:Uncharacterized protein n=1 Tax=Batillaria attramentaria TaxID=370345 RepID=A0ABD0KGJ9_9CAEN
MFFFARPTSPTGSSIFLTALVMCELLCQAAVSYLLSNRPGSPHHSYLPAALARENDWLYAFVPGTELRRPSLPLSNCFQCVGRGDYSQDACSSPQTQAKILLLYQQRFGAIKEKMCEKIDPTLISTAPHFTVGVAAVWRRGLAWRDSQLCPGQRRKQTNLTSPSPA